MYPAVHQARLKRLGGGSLFGGAQGDAAAQADPNDPNGANAAPPSASELIASQPARTMEQSAVVYGTVQNANNLPDGVPRDPNNLDSATASHGAMDVEGGEGAQGQDDPSPPDEDDDEGLVDIDEVEHPVVAIVPKWQRIERTRMIPSYQADFFSANVHGADEVYPQHYSMLDGDKSLWSKAQREFERLKVIASGRDPKAQFLMV